MIGAEAAAREIPNLPLDYALALIHLYADKRDRRYERAALRYLERYMAETNPSLEDVAGVECGCCSGELGKGWVAFMGEDPDGLEPPAIVVYCPPCAAAEFGYRPDVAEHYVCAWDPLPSETTDSV